MTAGFAARNTGHDATPPPGDGHTPFNLTWIVIWAGALMSVGRVRVALFPLWFLGIAAMANGIFHPLVAVAVRGYFPGLLTAPLLGLAGVPLFARLRRFTQPARVVREAEARA